MLAEMKALRESYGGDKNAINRHSVRYYEWPDVGFFAIDRTLNGNPKFFELTELYHDPRKQSEKFYIPRTIPIGRNRYFGDGLNWPQAEQLASEAIQKIIDEV